jgi:electron transfer flavoprotein alpha subunit
LANILSYIELVDEQASWASLLTLRQGRNLATRLGATLYAVLPCASPPLYGDNDIIAVLSRQGADKVILMTHAALAEPALFRRHGEALLTAASQFPPALLLLPRGPAASDLAPRVAARLGALFLQDPLLDVDSGHHLVLEQPTHERTQVRRFSTADLEHSVVAVVTPDPQRFSQAAGSEEAEVVVLSPVFKSPADGADPEDAGELESCLPERLILVGGGVDSAEAWDLARRLAERLGAALRQTRASAELGLAKDVPLLDPPCSGGLPGFVLSLGIGGDEDILASLPASSYLIAVHPDRDAPALAQAKLALVADVTKAVGEMLSAAGPRLAPRTPIQTEAPGGLSEPGAPVASVSTREEQASEGNRDSSNAPTVELHVVEPAKEEP